MFVLAPAANRPPQVAPRSAMASPAPAAAGGAVAGAAGVTLAADSAHFGGAPARVPAGARERQVPVRLVFQGGQLSRLAHIPVTADRAGSQPTVFLNYDETLLDGALTKAWGAIGRPLRPNAARFAVSGSHANGSNRSRLELGLRFANQGTAPIVLQLSEVAVGHHGQALEPSGGRAIVRTGPGTYRVTLKPNESVELPLAGVAAHTGSSPRDASRFMTYDLNVAVQGGDPAALVVQDVARHPQSAAKQAVTPPDAIDPKHHEGVFYPQRQLTPPVLLDENSAASFEIAGSQETHDAHYTVPHTFEVALPAGRTPQAIVFRGPGGLANPRVGWQKLPNPVGDLGGGPGAAPAGYARLKLHQTASMTLEAAVRGGYLVPTGRRDAGGNPIYDVTVTFLPGDEGNLGLYAVYGPGADGPANPAPIERP